jgi:hypothetical protein
MAGAFFSRLLLRPSSTASVAPSQSSLLPEHSWCVSLFWPVDPTRAVIQGLAKELDFDVRYLEKLVDQIRKDLA